MSSSIIFYFDFVSPYSYIANNRLGLLADRTGSQIEYRPFDLLALMKSVGNSPTTMVCAPKKEYAFRDLARWANRYGMPLSPNPNMRVQNSELLRSGVIRADKAGRAREYVDAVYASVWNSSDNLSLADEIVEALEHQGLSDASNFVSVAPESETLELYQNAAIAHGVFGSPSFLVNEELYFGNDRLEFVEAALAGGAKA